MLTSGSIVDRRYRILKAIGRGATSSVYLAENIRLGNYWAIKELYKDSISAQHVKGSGMLVETKILTELQHPGLPRIIDIIDSPGAYLIIMEYIEGESLDKLLKRSKAQTQKEVVGWSIQLCQVLEYLHGQSSPIIHRDIKPANIIRRKDGSMVLIDFGIARKYNQNGTADTDNLGTSGYAAPEQYNPAAQSDVRTDIYGLGVTMYELLTGYPPYDPEMGLRPITKINPQLSKKLEAIIQKCTSYDPKDRYQTVAELRAALEQVITDAKPQVREDEQSDSPKSVPGWMIGAGVGAILLVVILAVALALGTETKAKPSMIDAIWYRIESLIMGDVGTDVYFEEYVEVTYADERIDLYFEPERTGYHYIYSDSDNDLLPLAWLSDEDGDVVAEDNTWGDYTEFEIYCWLRAGETYTLQTTLYDLKEDFDPIGGYSIYVEYAGG